MCAKKTKITTLFNNLSPPEEEEEEEVVGSEDEPEDGRWNDKMAPWCHFGEYPLNVNSVCCSVSAAPRGYDTFSTLYPRGAADTEQHMRWGDAKEKNCLIKSLFLFSLRTKSILEAS